MYKIWKSCSRPTRKIKHKLNAKQYLLHMRHLPSTNIGRGFYTLQPCWIARLWHDCRLSLCQSVGRSVCHKCIVVKRCEIWPRLLLITNRKSHIGFLNDMKIIGLGWPWKVITHYSMPIVRYCDKTVSRKGSAIVLSDRALATSYRMSIVTMSPSVAVWPQFLMENFKL